MTSWQDCPARWLANAIVVRRSTELSCSSAQKRSIVTFVDIAGAVLEGVHLLRARSSNVG
ncbi:hypothetical protein WME90_23195 [Sorangium sp. So ce375]|uniref:hypothetical protein n=1 Tax=Sorangium sp. So ce375 TaxID=3133306 RepID=UPI003F5B7504